MIFPDDPAERKSIPLATGCLDYFPDALAAVAKVSVAGNKQHHPNTDLHWDKEKSKDHINCMARHFMERNGVDTDGIPHAHKMVWRALAWLQVRIEENRTSDAPRVGEIVTHERAAEAVRDAVDIPGD